MVAIRIPDSETRSVQTWRSFRRGDDAVFPTSRPAFVIVAPPGEEGFPVLGTARSSRPAATP